MMQVCECGVGKRHHPSEHFAKKRDAMIKEVKEFMDKWYPQHIFGDSFDRKAVELIAACFHLKDELP